MWLILLLFNILSSAPSLAPAYQLRVYGKSPWRWGNTLKKIPLGICRVSSSRWVSYEWSTKEGEIQDTPIPCYSNTEGEEVTSAYGPANLVAPYQGKIALTFWTWDPAQPRSYIERFDPQTLPVERLGTIQGAWDPQISTSQDKIFVVASISDTSFLFTFFYNNSWWDTVLIFSTTGGREIQQPSISVIGDTVAIACEYYDNDTLYGILAIFSDDGGRNWDGWYLMASSPSHPFWTPLIKIVRSEDHAHYFHNVWWWPRPIYDSTASWPAIRGYILFDQMDNSSHDNTYFIFFMRTNDPNPLGYNIIASSPIPLTDTSITIWGNSYSVDIDTNFVDDFPTDNYYFPNLDKEIAFTVAELHSSGGRYIRRIMLNNDLLEWYFVDGSLYGGYYYPFYTTSEFMMADTSHLNHGGGAAISYTRDTAIVAWRSFDDEDSLNHLVVAAATSSGVFDTLLYTNFEFAEGWWNYFPGIFQNVVLVPYKADNGMTDVGLIVYTKEKKFLWLPQKKSEEKKERKVLWFDISGRRVKRLRKWKIFINTKGKKILRLK